MLDLIIQTATYFLPAGIANITPPLIRKINILNKPINKQKLGEHKTWRGLVFGIIAATITGTIQQNPLLGFIQGSGALTGDIVKSYFKRKKGIQPGQNWIPYDQIDWIIGTIIFTIPYNVPINMMITAIILGITAHISMNYIGRILGINK